MAFPKYFRNVPDFDYVSRLPGAKNISDYVRVKNLFRRAKIREDIFQDITYFTKYKVNANDRPDNVAKEIYGDSNLDWLVMLSNNIINLENEWQLQQRDDLESLPWVIPFKAWHPEGLEFNALAVWTVENKSVSSLSYAKQITRLINTYSKEIKSENLSIIGDFNTSIQGPSKGPHQENLQLLDSLNLFSAYHTLNGLNHGEEKEMTLKWIGPGKKEYLYHCDFIFLQKKILNGGMSFIYELWSGEHTKLSDHQPVVVDIQDMSLQ